jgi:alpha-ketoglutarate-dependent taurine dioxygenase
MKIYTIENVKASDVLENHLYYQELLIEHKVLGFRNLAPSNEEHQEILKKMYKENLNTIELNSEKVGKSIHQGLNIPSDKDDQQFIASNWHVDFLPGSKNSYAHISMHMDVFNCAPDVGQTLFINLIDLYQRCPDEYKKNINKEDFKFTNIRGAKPLEYLENRTHKAIRVHPVTGENILFWTGGFGDLNKKESYIISLNNEIWFNNFSDWVLSELQNKNNWGIWSWNKDDYLIWDNRALIHSFTAGWNKEDRVFNRSNIGLEKTL